MRRRSRRSTRCSARPIRSRTSTPSWKDILFNQFHDILPGSGIHINYVDAARKYEVASRIDNDMIHAALNDIASRVKSDGVSVLVFNPLSWPRTEEVEVEAQFPDLPSPLGVIAVDPNKTPARVRDREFRSGNRTGEGPHPGD